MDITITKEGLKAFIKRDFIYIVVMLLCLIALVWVNGSVKGYQAQCSTYYKDYFVKCGCQCSNCNIGIIDTIPNFSKNFSYLIPISS